MDAWFWWTLVGLFLLFGLALLYFAWRTHYLGHRLGSFECAYRRDLSAGWTAGIAVFGGDRLEWYRVISFALAPSFSWDRSALEVRSTLPRGPFPAASGVTEIGCDYRDHRFILAMRSADYSGFVSWLEGAPPTTELFY